MQPPHEPGSAPEMGLSLMTQMSWTGLLARGGAAVGGRTAANC